MIIMKKKETGSLIGGAVSLTVSVLIVKVIGFIYKLPLSYVLGDEGMGYFNSAYTIFTFFYMLCSGGVPKAVSILIAEKRAKNDYYGIERILSSAVKIFVTVGVAFSVALFVFSDFFAVAIGNELSAFSLIAIAPSLMFVSAAGVFRGYLNGSEKMLPIAVSEVIEGLIKFILGLAMALLGNRLGYENQIVSALAILGVSIGAFFGAAFLLVCVKIDKKEHKTEQNTQTDACSREFIFAILRISVPITLSAAIMGISNLIDLGMIMKRLVSIGVSEGNAVAAYGNFTTLVIPMVNLIMAIASPLSNAALPRMTMKYTSGNLYDFSNFVGNVLTFISFVASPLFFAYLLFSNEILLFLFEDSSAAFGAPLLTVLSPAVVLIPFLTVLNTALEASSKPKLSLASMAVGAVVKLLGSYFLIGRFGIHGAPLSSILSYAISFLISFACAQRYTGLKFGALLEALPSFLIAGFSVSIFRFAYIGVCKGGYNTFLFLSFAMMSALVYILLSVIFARRKIKLIIKSVNFNKKREKTL